MTGAAKALKLSGSDLSGREVYIDSARERGQGGGGGGERTPGTAGRDSDGTTVFVKGFDRYLGGEDEVTRFLPLSWPFTLVFSQAVPAADCCCLALSCYVRLW